MGLWVWLGVFLGKASIGFILYSTVLTSRNSLEPWHWTVSFFKFLSSTLATHGMFSIFNVPEWPAALGLGKCYLTLVIPRYFRGWKHASSLERAEVLPCFEGLSITVPCFVILIITQDQPECENFLFMISFTRVLPAIKLQAPWKQCWISSLIAICLRPKTDPE